MRIRGNKPKIVPKANLDLVEVLHGLLGRHERALLQLDRIVIRVVRIGGIALKVKRI